MFTGGQDISCAPCTRCTLSLSFPVPEPTVCPSICLSLCPCQMLFWQLCTDQLWGMTSLSSSPCWYPSIQSVSQLAPINPSLPVPQLPPATLPPASLSISPPAFSPPRPARVGEFHPACGIAPLINSYAGMFAGGQRAAPAIPDSDWDYGGTVK